MAVSPVIESDETGKLPAQWANVARFNCNCGSARDVSLQVPAGGADGWKYHREDGPL